MALSACSTEGFSEMVGLSKSAPDETKVTTVQPLALPPDYSLPPPQEPRQIAEPEPAPEVPPVRTASAAVPTQAAGNDGTAAPAAAGTEEAQDPYAISPTNPDGTPKTQQQIREEARAKKMARAKAQNADYGTWRNLFKILWD